MKPENDIPYFDTRNSKKRELSLKWKTYLQEELPDKYRKKPNPFKQLQYLFDAYAKHFNNKYNRRGRIFEKNFGVREIENNDDLLGIIHYINFNPEKHSVVKDFRTYQYSSYFEIKNGTNDICDVDSILELYGGMESFINAHNTGN